MPRFAFTSLLLLLIVGCQTAARGPQPTILVNSTQPATPAKTFWNRTAQFLQPLMPDRGHRPVESSNHLAVNRPHSDILPINHSAHSLYKAGSIFPSSALIPQQPEEHVLVAETTINAVSASLNPLQIQSGDSEAFKSLLREIAIMPPEKRNVDDTRLATLLTTFRDGIMDSDVEVEFLALLRRQILPEPKLAAPLPNAELAEIRRSAGNPVRSREPEWDDDEYIYNEPIIRQVARRIPQEEPIVAQNSIPMAAPIYPDLPQLPSAVPATIQTSYQSQSVALGANITSHGAGDWQAPTRAAIEQLRYAIEQTPNGRTVSNEMRLRMLEMLLGNRVEAARPMQSADKVINNFMGHQVLGFAELLDDSMPNNRSRYVSAAYRLSEGLTELQNLCPIKLKNVTFAQDWFGYGQVIPRPTQEFHPGEDFYVYVEIENPSVRRVPDGFEVSYAISYEIRDSHARVVDRKEIGEQGERAVTRKRDYWIPVRGKIPESLAPGQYHLRISMIDLNDDSMQYAEEQIPFRVAPSLTAGR